MSEHIITWSYSGLTKFENCPRQYQKTVVTKEVKDEPTSATIWGTEVHLALERRVRDNVPLPDGMKQFESLASSFARYKGIGKVICEFEMALDQSMNPVPFDSPKRWVRGIADIVFIQELDENKWVAFVGDYKTGKKRTGSMQLALMAAMLFAHFPKIQKITTGFIWLIDCSIGQEEYYRAHLPKIWGEFMPRVARLEQTFAQDKWIPSPSGLCGWCPCTRKECNYAKKR